MHPATADSAQRRTAHSTAEAMDEPPRHRTMHDGADVARAGALDHRVLLAVVRAVVYAARA